MSQQAPPAEALGKLDGRLLDLLPGAVYLCDHEGVPVRWNRRAVDLWGREPKAGDRSERFCGSHTLCPLTADGTKDLEPLRKGSGKYRDGSGTAQKVPPSATFGQSAGSFGGR